MPVRSMTGFGTGQAPLGTGRVVAEIRTVNGRTLDVRVRAPECLDGAAPSAEQRVRERLRRGRIDVSLRTEGSVIPPPVLDVDRALAAVQALETLRDRVAPSSELPLSLLSLVPGLFAPPAEETLFAMRAAIAAAVDRALDGVVTSRSAEGMATARDLAGRIAIMRAARDRVAERARELPSRAFDKLRARLAALVGEGALDGARLEMEAAIVADRADVHEELARLGTHLEHFEEVVAWDDEDGAGRRLDFLLQEMQREATTLGAKSQDAAIARDVVAMKVEIERMREQVQNVE